MNDDERQPGLLIALREETYFVPGDQQELLDRIEGVLREHGFIVPKNLIAPDDLFRFRQKEIRDLLCGAVTIVFGRK